MMTESRVNAQSFGQPFMIVKANKKAISLRLSLYCSSYVSKQMLTLEALLVTDILKDKPSLIQSQSNQPIAYITRHLPVHDPRKRQTPPTTPCPGKGNA